MNHWWHRRTYPISRPWGDKMPRGVIDPALFPGIERFQWPLLSPVQQRMIWRKTENVPLWSIGMDLSYKSPAVCCWNAQTRICWFIYVQPASKKSFLSTSSSTIYHHHPSHHPQLTEKEEDEESEEEEQKQKRKKKKKPDRWTIRRMGLLSSDPNERNNKQIHQIRFIRIQYPKTWVRMYVRKNDTYFSLSTIVVISQVQRNDFK
jgi:hypothetical protein